MKLSATHVTIMVCTSIVVLGAAVVLGKVDGSYLTAPIAALIGWVARSPLEKPAQIPVYVANDTELQ